MSKMFGFLIIVNRYEYECLKFIKDYKEDKARVG